jgi:hypothetical protein
MTSLKGQAGGTGMPLSQTVNKAEQQDYLSINIVSNLTLSLPNSPPHLTHSFHPFVTLSSFQIIENTFFRLKKCQLDSMTKVRKTMTILNSILV